MVKLTKSYKEHLYERLKDPAQAAGYLNTVLEEEDAEVFLLALRHVAEARGIARVAAAAGLNRENAYRILSDQGNPRLSSMMALLRAVGIQLQVKPNCEVAAGEPLGGLTVVKPSLLTTDNPEFPHLRSHSPAEESSSYYGTEDEPAAA